MSERVLVASPGPGGAISYLVPDTDIVFGQKILRAAHTSFLAGIGVADRVIALTVTGKDGNIAYNCFSDFEQTTGLLFGYTWGLTGTFYNDNDIQEVSIPMDAPVVLAGDTIKVFAKNIDPADIFSTLLLSFD